jgi:hypothetical protein
MQQNPVEQGGPLIGVIKPFLSMMSQLKDELLGAECQEATSRSANEEIPHLVCNTKVHNCVHKRRQFPQTYVTCPNVLLFSR